MKNWTLFWISAVIMLVSVIGLLNDNSQYLYYFVEVIGVLLMASSVDMILASKKVTKLR